MVEILSLYLIIMDGEHHQLPILLTFLILMSENLTDLLIISNSCAQDSVHMIICTVNWIFVRIQMWFNDEPTTTARCKSMYSICMNNESRAWSNV